jgi:arginine N-succinyltransferase
MLAVRNACEADLDAVLELAAGAGPGMTTLKPDRGALAARLALAAASFAGEVPPQDAGYLFVLEDLGRRRICGVSAIKAAVGLKEPFYNYRLGTSVHTSPATGLVNRVRSLHLSHDLCGASELCSLYLHPDYRGGSNGRLLSKSRFLFLAQFPELFAPRVFAEMRGFQDEHGQSPFWESVGRPFFRMDFDAADDLCGKGERQFIEQLVPRLPLYTHLLGDAARAAIGRTHADTVPARRLLEQEGLHFDGYIDIFDGGPVLEAKLPALRAVRDSRLHVAGSGAPAAALAGSPTGQTRCLVATTRRERFRVVVADLEPPPPLRLGRPVLAALGAEPGALLRVLPLDPVSGAGDPHGGASRLCAAPR